jgi:membrane protease YdiL (CAAX protease family)
MNRAYHSLAGNRAALAGMLFAVIVGAGLAGAQQATITGLVFGTIFAATGRLWMLMCAHAAFDLVALALIYWNLESDVAHLVFK